MKTKIYFRLFLLVLIGALASCSSEDEILPEEPQEDITKIVEETEFGTIIRYYDNTATRYGTYHLRGYVYGSDNEPIPGATVAIKDTEVGTVADSDGAYIIRVWSNDIVIYSFLGYVTQAVHLKGATHITVYLKEDI